MKRIKQALTLGVVSLFLMACEQAQQTQNTAPADMVFYGGPILTMQDALPVAAALAVKDGRISGLSAGGEIDDFVGPDTKLVDLQGQALMPGFFQSHAHFGFISMKDQVVNLDPPPAGNTASMDNLIGKLKQAAAQMPPEIPAGIPVFGIGYDDTLMREQRHPTRADLDKVSTTRPVVVLHISAHLASMNSKALEIAGLDADTPDPEGGIIRRMADGTTPNGVLEESALKYMMTLLPNPEPAQVFKGFDDTIQKMLSLGITTIVDHATDLATEAGYRAYFGMQERPVDMVSYRQVTPELKDMTGISASYENGNRTGGVKVLLDGSLQGYTGYLTKPYHKTIAPHHHGHRGYPHMSADQLEEIIMQAYAGDIPVLVHTNGDAAIDMFIGAIDKATQRYPDKQLRPVLIHAQTMRQDQLEAANALDMIPSFFVDHVYFWGDRHRDLFLGPERAAAISPAASAHRLGMTFTLHDDAPVVAAHPMRSAWVAVNRRTAGGKELGAEQKIDVLTALKALTINSAYQHFEEAEKGSLEIGKKADIIILDQNPLTIAPSALRDITVMQTFKNGEQVFLRKEQAGQ